jgi:Domain of unknown function (DUF6362)
MIHAELATAWLCPTCGNTIADACNTPGPGCRIDSEWVQAKLEAAGSTLLAMRCRSPFPAEYGSCMPDFVREAKVSYGWDVAEYRPPVPSSHEIDTMDATWRWLGLVPSHRHVLRRIVAARSLTSPVTGRHLLHWRALGDMLHADYRAVRRWHRDGIAIITERLRP